MFIGGRIVWRIGQGGNKDATETRVEPEGDIEQHQEASERGQTAQAGDSDSAESGTASAEKEEKG